MIAGFQLRLYACARCGVAARSANPRSRLCSACKLAHTKEIRRKYDNPNGKRRAR